VQNVRWDVEDDLARVVGDVPAHYAVKMINAVKAKLQDWLVKK
jgi:ubiquinone biosynthesis protein UbiJ